MGIVYIGKCRCEIQEQKEVPLWLTGVYRPVSRSDVHFKYILLYSAAKASDWLCGENRN
jgi:hypothetical protein